MRISDMGKYLTVWRKETDDNWRIVTEIWNSDVPLGSTGP